MKKLYCIALLFFAFSARSLMVINEVYGGGGKSGATYKKDFIELFNNGATAVQIHRHFYN